MHMLSKNRKGTIMKMDNNRSNVPSLRFNGFSGEWKEMKLREIGTFLKGQSLSKGELNDHGKNLCIHYGELFTKYSEIISSIVSKTDSQIRVGSKYGDILFPASDVTPTGLARCSTLLIDDVLLGGDIIIFRPQGSISPGFLSYAINNQKKAMVRLVAGAVVKHITPGELASLSIALPPTIDEQEIIAACLSDIDSIITTQGLKVNALKEMKQGLLQQFFPHSGETTPRLRFLGFTEDWEEKKLGDLAHKMNRRNRQLEVSRVLTNSAIDGIVDQSTYFDKDIAVRGNTDNYHIVELNDFVYNPRISTAAPVGPISINKIGKGIMSPLYTVFKFYKGYVPFFEHYFQTTIWHPYLKSIANFGARYDRMNITSEGFFDMPIYFPSSLAEQKKIASCLSSLDDTIQSEIDKLEALKAHKKGLMQQLFPQPTK